MGKRKSTPEELDYLFERGVIDEEDYVEFWLDYWEADASGRQDIVDYYTALAASDDNADNVPSVGVVTKVKTDAIKQAQALSETTDRAYKVARRNARGQFSTRGHYYQAVRAVPL
jgi:hypothetical protein